MWRLILIMALTVGATAQAEVIEFPEEELAKESVLPVFDRREVVKNRNVVTEGRFEFGAGWGMNMTEALYNQMNYNINATYHFTETHGLNIAGTFPMSGISSTAQSLKEAKGTEGIYFDAGLAPSVKSLVFGQYQFTAYYGKISLTKKFVMNLSLYGLAGLGAVSFDDKTSIGANVGFGQKFYFTKNLAARLDLSLVGYRGPDPTSNPGAIDPNSVSERQASSVFDETTYYHTYLALGLVYLL